MTLPQQKYRIQTVSKLTGVPAATLRAWERRYGLPKPSRTASAYRLYTDRDVQTIQRLKSMCDAGMSPSEAAKIVAADSTSPSDDVHTLEPSNDAFAPSRTAILQAIAEFDPIALEHAVQHCLTLGSATTIFDRIIRMVMHEVGQRWVAGEFSVGQEHLATQVMESAARRLLSLVQPVEGSRQVLLACMGDESHVLPLFGVALHLASVGFRSVVLGANTPPSAVRHAVNAIELHGIGLSITMELPPYQARELADAYGAACAQRPWVVGGQGASTIAPFVEAAGGTILNDNQPQMLVRLFGRAPATHAEPQTG